MKEKIKKIDKEKVVVFVFGLAVGLISMLAFYPERIAKLKDGEEVAIKIGKTNVTADDLYKGFKSKYAVNELIEVIDKTILENKYDMDEEDWEEVKKTADNYLSMYEEYYGMTQEDFLSKNGFESYDDFKTYLSLDYLRNKYYVEYLYDQIKDEEVEEFYEDEVFGTINVEHILVKVGDDVTKDEAKEIGKDILKDLANDYSWEAVKDEYEDKITVEELKVEFDSNYEEAFEEAAEALKDDSYSKALVETSYGYHIINRISSEDKAKLSKVEDRIKAVIIKEKEAEDENLYEKVMIQMRKDADTKIKDTLLKKEYNKYIKTFK